MSQHNGNIRFDVAQACIWLERMFDQFPELAEDYQLRLDTIEGETEIFALIDQLLEINSAARGMRTGINAEMQRLRAREERMEARELMARNCIAKLLEAANMRKAERPAATVSMQSGKAHIVITDENELPEQFIRVKREPNKEEIAKALKEGQSVPGAMLSNSAPVLRIS